MKKLLLFSALLIAAVFNSAKAQCPLTEAIDFEATDVHGEEIHLFDLLDDGKYVLIDFFFTTCPPCQGASPLVNEAYKHFGCNEGDLFVVSISYKDNNAACIQYDETYGVEFPTIGTEGNGAQITSDYQIPQFPTIILIAPDRSIVEKDIWPIESAQFLIDKISSHGIKEMECGAVGIQEQVETNYEVQLFPNPSNGEINITFIPSNDQMIQIFDINGKNVYQENVTEESDRAIIKKIQLDALQSGMYFMQISSGNETICKQKFMLN